MYGLVGTRDVGALSRSINLRPAMLTDDRRRVCGLQARMHGYNENSSAGLCTIQGACQRYLPRL